MGDYVIDRVNKIRYILDAFVFDNGMHPIPEGLSYSFSTKDQATQIQNIANQFSNEINFKIVDGTKALNAGIVYNYRNMEDPDNLIAWILSYEGVVNGKPGKIEQYVGDLIRERHLTNPNASRLEVDSIGQLVWK